MTRRDALCRIGTGFGMTAFASLASSVARASASTRGVLDKLHFKPKAKRVIFLLMNGGVSQVDTFDPKPKLAEYDGKPMPGEPIKTERKTGVLLRSPFTFKKYADRST